MDFLQVLAMCGANRTATFRGAIMFCLKHCQSNAEDEIVREFTHKMQELVQVHPDRRAVKLK